MCNESENDLTLRHSNLWEKQPSFAKANTGIATSHCSLQKFSIQYENPITYLNETFIHLILRLISDIIPVLIVLNYVNVNCIYKDDIASVPQT